MSSTSTPTESIDSVMCAENNQILTDNSIELIRKSCIKDSIDTSWDQSYYVSFHNKDIENKTPPFVSMNKTDDEAYNQQLDEDKITIFKQTEISSDLTPNIIPDVSISFSKDSVESISHELVETNYLIKRSRHDSTEGNCKDSRPSKKTKCSDSCSSSESDLSADPIESRDPSISNQLSSNSEIAFKSVKSICSYKIKRRRLKSTPNLFRDAITRSRLSSNNHLIDNPSGGSPRKDRNRRSARTKSWKILDLCSWIRKKGYQSLTTLYSDVLRDPTPQHAIACPASEEVKQLRQHLVDVDHRQTQLTRENEFLQNTLKKMMKKIEELETKMSSQAHQSKPAVAPPPPPPPPPPPVSRLPMRSNTLPCCGSAPPRITTPRLTITPQDIANVKLRKTKENPVKKQITKEKQPLVTQQMLLKTKAKLGRVRPVAASTPKQQLSDLEKCLLQETTVTSLYRRRVAGTTTFLSAAELRPRPYPVSRCIRSPKSPRSSSHLHNE